MRIEDFDAATGHIERKDKGDLSLYTYTAACAYERAWTETTRAARGIVFDRTTGTVVARPFPKFFNLGEMPDTQPEALPATPFRVEEKIDGSLGILFNHRGAWDVCTKGAFDSEQAKYVRANFMPGLAPSLALVPDEWTILTEIVYPENRIVVDYGGARELVALAAIQRETGHEMERGPFEILAGMLGLRPVPVHDYTNLLDLPFQENAEGYVARFENGLRVKVKSPRYKQIHRLLEYTSPRRVLDMLEAGEYEAVRAQIPNDIAGEFDDVSSSLRMALLQLQNEGRDTFATLQHLRADRKAFALAAKATARPEVLPMMFALLDDKSIERVAYGMVRKSLGRPPDRGRGEGSECGG